MILLRYPGARTAQRVAPRLAANRAAARAVEIELVTETDGVADTSVNPRFGSGALARSNVISWGGLGLVCGALLGWKKSRSRTGRARSLTIPRARSDSCSVSGRP